MYDDVDQLRRAPRPGQKDSPAGDPYTVTTQLINVTSQNRPRIRVASDTPNAEHGTLLSAGGGRRTDLRLLGVVATLLIPPPLRLVPLVGVVRLLGGSRQTASDDAPGRAEVGGAQPLLYWFMDG